MQSILVVCEGNICRSPMAQGLLAAALPGKHVSSAGLGALVGKPADPTATKLMASRGIDIGAHRAIQIGAALCNGAELILVMEQQQRERLESMYPQVRGRVFRLAEHGAGDIPDPYRRGELAFANALDLIELGVREWLQRIRKIERLDR